MVASKQKIEDAGEKLWGARKDATQATGAEVPPASQEVCLDALWPKPDNWTDLITTVGAQRAAVMMVLHGNLAKQPHRDGWIGVSGESWKQAYAFGIQALRELLLTSDKTELPELTKAFDCKMHEFEKLQGAPPNFKNQWSYAIGCAGTRKSKHPFKLTPIDDLRARYLGMWGWGTDPRVNNHLAVGAIQVTAVRTGEVLWKAVKGTAGRWTYIDGADFVSEQDALECAAKVVATLLDAPKPVRKSHKDHGNWIRPHVTSENIRGGFASENSAGRTQDDLLKTFGFRGVEFGNWVTQGERQKFVDAAYDAFMDLTLLLGMPPVFASLSGKLGLAYGSRGKGLSKAVAHFEPANWVLHMTKEGGPGSLAHEFGHAIDCWIADLLFGKTDIETKFASSVVNWQRKPQVMAAHPEIAQALQDWRTLTSRYPENGDRMAWIEASMAMDSFGDRVYWADPIEIFARAFEVLVLGSLKAKSRNNDMLVYGIGDEDGLVMRAASRAFPYPLGIERIQTCEAMAVVVRAYRGEFRKSLTAQDRF